MKKEVAVCDLSSEHGGTCMRLAEFVCPICKRDVCAEHRSPRLSVRIRIFWPNRPQGNGQNPKDEEAAPRDEQVGVCSACFRSASTTPLTTVVMLTRKTLQDAIEAYGADFAAAQLARARTADDND